MELGDLSGWPADALIAVEPPAGAEGTVVVETLMRQGHPFLVLDSRWTPQERRRVVELARPAGVVTPRETAAHAGALADSRPVDPARVAWVVASSGTAGEPRLVELGPNAVAAAVDASLDVLGAAGEDPWVSCLSPVHVGGLLVLARAAASGARLVAMDRFDPDRLLDDAPARANLALVPAMLRRLVEAGRDLSGLGVLLIGGDALDPELRRRAETLGGTVVATYGLTESCGGVVYDGRPVGGTEVRVAAGGEILLRGPTLMTGYRNDPEATRRAFTDDGWLRTGDLGALAPDGELRVHGRSADAIRTGSETVWPDEVERALADLAGVADVAVDGRPDPEWGERVVAFVVPDSAADPPTLDALRTHGAARLARFKLPHELVLVAAVPRTASGKVRRRDLPGAMAKARAREG